MRRRRFLAAGVLLAACSSAMAIEKPTYTVIRTLEAFEVRRYKPCLVAEPAVAATSEEAGNQGFRILAGYIFGSNKGARENETTAPVAQAPAKIAITVPVAHSASAGDYLVHFTMPREGQGEPTWARYNSPWTPWFLRRNEIWLALD